MDAQLPSGLNKQSFALPFRGGMIWCEHLDSLFSRGDLAIAKLERDQPSFLRPSGASQMALAVAQTDVSDALLDAIAQALTQPCKRFQRVAVVGMNRRCQRALERRLRKQGAAFALYFTEDFEQAKEWLIPEETR